MIPNIRLYLELAAALLLVAAFIGYSVHERHVGQANLQHSVDAATLEAQRKAAAETAKLQAKADIADREAIHAQDQLSAYLAAHPVGPVSVCHQAASGRPSVPQSTTPASTATGTAPAAGGLPSVPASVAGPDISRGLSAIVRAAGILAIDEKQYQQLRGLK